MTSISSSLICCMERLAWESWLGRKKLGVNSLAAVVGCKEHDGLCQSGRNVMVPDGVYMQWPNLNANDLGAAGVDGNAFCAGFTLFRDRRISLWICTTAFTLMTSIFRLRVSDRSHIFFKKRNTKRAADQCSGGNCLIAPMANSRKACLSPGFIAPLLICNPNCSNDESVSSGTGMHSRNNFSAHHNTEMGVLREMGSPESNACSTAYTRSVSGLKMPSNSSSPRSFSMMSHKTNSPRGKDG
mmetsp:Transcript_41083/g.124051  ORF Transcript_41083/g.124051 Transcript_41083/m.124051 type:complete len:242 (-) Transcript_41083:911-1636(-)